MRNLKEVILYDTYKEYCDDRRRIGLGVIPESLFNALKKDSLNG